MDGGVPLMDRNAHEAASMHDVEAETDLLLDVAGLDTSIPPPADGSRTFASCTPFPCAHGQFCIDHEQILSMPIGDYAVCEELPGGCEGSPSCLCVVHSAPWCAHPMCVAEAAEVKLTCILMPP